MQKTQQQIFQFLKFTDELGQERSHAGELAIDDPVQKLTHATNNDNLSTAGKQPASSTG